jgi:deoxyribodipyrimidine photo-lyase
MTYSVRLSLWWIKRDIRTCDNEALVNALNYAREKKTAIAGIYILDKAFLLHPETSLLHAEMIGSALQDLAVNLSLLHIPLLLWTGECEDLQNRLEQRSIRIKSVHSHEETGTHQSYERDRRFHRYCRERHIEWSEAARNGVIRGLKNRDDRIDIFRARMNSPPIEAPHGLEKKQLQRQKNLQDLVLDLKFERNSFMDSALRHCLDPRLSAYASHLYEKMLDPCASYAVTEEERTLITGLIPPPDDCFLPRQTASALQECSEKAAKHTAHTFFSSRAFGHSGGLSSMNSAPEHCSRFSVHLSWGTKSVRQAIQWTEKRIDELGDKSTHGWKKSLRDLERRLH